METRNTSKLLALLSLFAVCFSPVSGLSAAETVTLEDVDFLVSMPISDIGNSFARDDIIAFLEKGYIKGYDDDTFRPDSSITRAEFLALTMQAMGTKVNDAATTSSYKDISATWIIKYAERAREYGIKGETRNGLSYFRPNDPITRAEAMAMLLRIGGIEVPDAVASSFSDVSVAWMIKYVEKAKSLGITSGQRNRFGQLIFRPGDPITRAESVRIITKAMTYKK